MPDNSQQAQSANVVFYTEQLAAAVAAIEGASAAVADFFPDFGLSDVTSSLKIVVTPQSEKTIYDTRGSDEDILKIGIAVMQKATAQEAQNLLLLCQNIAEELRAEKIGTAQRFGIVKQIDRDPIYDLPQMVRTKIFISVITVTIKVLK